MALDLVGTHASSTRRTAGCGLACCRAQKRRDASCSLCYVRAECTNAPEAPEPRGDRDGEICCTRDYMSVCKCIARLHVRCTGVHCSRRHGSRRAEENGFHRSFLIERVTESQHELRNYLGGHKAQAVYRENGERGMSGFHYYITRSVLTYNIN